MGSRLARLVAPVLLPIALILTQGCEDESYDSTTSTTTTTSTTQEPQRDPMDIGHEVPAGVKDLYGTWYKPEKGWSNISMDGGVTWNPWAYHWGNITLSQKGTSLSGYSKWERYPSHKVTGRIDGDKIHLDEFAGTNVYKFIDGTIDETSKRMDIFEYYIDSGIRTSSTYSKLNELFGAMHDPMKTQED